MAAALSPVVLTADERSEVEAEAKYAGYLVRQDREVERMRQLEGKTIPEAIDYAAVRGLSNEARARLAARRPRTVGEASRLPGVTPADVQLLLVVTSR